MKAFFSIFWVKCTFRFYSLNNNVKHVPNQEAFWRNPV